MIAMCNFTSGEKEICALYITQHFTTSRVTIANIYCALLLRCPAPAHVFQRGALVRCVTKLPRNVTQ